MCRNRWLGGLGVVQRGDADSNQPGYLYVYSHIVVFVCIVSMSEKNTNILRNYLFLITHP